jgi:hypothetical protein
MTREAATTPSTQLAAARTTGLPSSGQPLTRSSWRPTTNARYSSSPRTTLSWAGSPARSRDVTRTPSCPATGCVRPAGCGGGTRAVARCRGFGACRNWSRVMPVDNVNVPRLRWRNPWSGCPATGADRCGAARPVQATARSAGPTQADWQAANSATISSSVARSTLESGSCTRCRARTRGEKPAVLALCLQRQVTVVG